MRHLWFVALVPLAGCNAATPAAVSITIQVKRDLCAPLAGATVAALDHPATATADADGRALLTAPSTTTLLVSAPGYVTTLSSVRNLAPGVSPRPLIATSQSLFDAGHTLAGIDPDPKRGTVVVSFVNDQDLPIADVQ